jgi:hypothetical protein
VHVHFSPFIKLLWHFTLTSLNSPKVQPDGQEVLKMQHVTAARSEIGPLLDELIVQLEEEGSATQKAHFKRIRGRLYTAHDEWELTTPIIELSTCIAMGFRFSQTADALINRILQKTTALVRELEGVEPRIH